MQMHELVLEIFGLFGSKISGQVGCILFDEKRQDYYVLHKRYIKDFLKTFKMWLIVDDKNILGFIGHSKVPVKGKYSILFVVEDRYVDEISKRYFYGMIDFIANKLKIKKDTIFNLYLTSSEDLSKNILDYSAMSSKWKPSEYHYEV